MNNNLLDKLYDEHDGKVSDKWSLYIAEYDRIFNEYRTKPIRMLEIGVQNGGSLEIWSQYFPYARKIVGCDVNPYCSSLKYEDERIVIVTGNANSPSTKRLILQHCSEFDIIVDDGSHLSSDIVKSFTEYFPNIVDGGVFVVEDLHCSYWREFEGGLFEPFSSVAFFKRLVDVLNHEHWGVDKSREELFNGFREKYGIGLDEALLEQVHSVEFINSMCVVKKCRHENNSLGIRRVAGRVESVVKGHLDLPNDALIEVPEQSGNPWSARAMPPEEELPIRLKELAESKRQLSVMLNSKSWRITRPLRFIAHQIRRLRHLWRLAPVVIRRWGFWNTIVKTMGVLRRDGLEGIRQALVSLESGRNDYARWLALYDTIDDGGREKMRQRVAEMGNKPLISVVMPVYNPRVEWLVEAIESVRAQIYPHWELCIADDCSTDPGVREELERYQAMDSRIKVVFREKNGHISKASNSALDIADGDWIALLDHDDLLHEQALFWVADVINKNPDAAMIYSDEDKIDANGNRFGPYFKSDWNPDLFLSHNLITHLGVYRSEMIHEVGGFRSEFDGAQDYDLALRVIERISHDDIIHIPRILYHWRVHDKSTASSADAKPYAMIAGEKAINDHFSRIGLRARAELIGFGYRVHYALPEPLPMVSIIVPIRNELEVSRRCLSSLFDKTEYPAYEIIVIDNGSDDPATLEWLFVLEQNECIRLLRDFRPFNYSALNNLAVAEASGEFVCLLNNDTEVISPGWLREMVSIAAQPGVGAVGARLWYPDDTLQHGGIFLGPGGVAGHMHDRLPKGQPGYAGRASLTQTVSAVTAACLVVRKSIYQEVGGLDEVNLAISYNDVDFCLRLREAGYRNVWTPFAELYHHESLTRGYEDTPDKLKRFNREASYMKYKWGDKLLNDPYYNPNLTLEAGDFGLAWPPRVGSV